MNVMDEKNMVAIPCNQEIIENCIEIIKIAERLVITMK